MREAELERKVCAEAERLGWWQAKFTSPGLRGVPDRILIRRGVFMFFEFKAKGLSANIQQQRRHKELQAAGAVVHVVDTYEQAIELLK